MVDPDVPRTARAHRHSGKVPRMMIRRPLALSASLLVIGWANAAAAQQVAEPAGGQPTVAPPSAPTPPPPGVVLPEVAPIIDDEEFEKAIPPISAEDDPELDRPLESIADFERMQASGNGRTGAASANIDIDEEDGGVRAPRVNGVPVPALADGDAVEVIGDAPITDTELVAPLPPLDSFDVEPVQFAEEESDREARQVSYTVEVRGLESADESAGVSLAGLFRDLSALRGGKGKADNAAMVRARMNADIELMQRILASEGYYDAEVRARVERAGQGRGQPLVAILDVTPGQRYTFSDIVIDAQPTMPPGLIRDNFPLAVGQPIVADRVQGAEAAIALKLPEQGYPFATVGQRDILLDGATGDGVYTLPVDTGPRARFGGIETTGNLAFDAEHVGVLSRFRRGDLYDSRMVDDLRQALVATGLFATVAVEPQKTGESAGDDTEYVTMMVTQQKGPPRTLAASAGYGTGEGIRLEGSWTHRNLFPPEGALIGRAIAGTQEQGLSATLRRSNAGRRDRTFELVTEALRSDYNAFEAWTGRVAARVSYDSTPIWQKKFTYAYGFELIATSEDDYDFALGRRTRDFYTIFGMNGQVGIDRTDSLLDPTRGFRITALVQPEGSLAGRFSPYARARIDASGYYSVTDDILLAGRVRVGSILGAARERLAPSRRFYGGGGGSVRGFGYQQLGPKDPNYDPIGGRSINEAAVEARYRFGDFGIVGFVDAGQVYRGSTPTFQDMRFGAGIGARYYTNFGPMRIDVATPIERKPGEARISVYVSIGQAF
jgi:translocation and assembly module TamA